MSGSDDVIDWILSADKSAVIRYLFLVIAASAIMWIAATGVQRVYGVEWFPALNATGSVALTAILATLYFRQSKVLESQQELLTAELNRGVREKHTEILRERVQEWHGNIEMELTEEDPWDAPSDNLPAVGRASFKSADPSLFLTDAGKEFTAVPSQLKNDRYFRDLIENHATELRTKARRIEILQSEFEKVKTEFIEKFDYAKSVEHDQYKLQPSDYTTEWVFEQLVQIERRSVDFEEVRDRMVSQISETGTHPEEPALWVSKSVGGTSRGVYRANFSSDQDIPPREEWEQVENKIKELFASMLDEVESDAPFDEIQLAAELLNDGASAIDDLRHTLVEYNGRLVYPGDCDYLREAEIRPNEER